MFCTLRMCAFRRYFALCGMFCTLRDVLHSAGCVALCGMFCTLRQMCLYSALYAPLHSTADVPLHCTLRTTALYGRCAFTLHSMHHSTLRTTALYAPLHSTADVPLHCTLRTTALCRMFCTLRDVLHSAGCVALCGMFCTLRDVSHSAGRFAPDTCPSVPAKGSD